jgi:hypothetical protein
MIFYLFNRVVLVVLGTHIHVGTNYNTGTRFGTRTLEIWLQQRKAVPMFAYTTIESFSVLLPQTSTNANIRCNHPSGKVRQCQCRVDQTAMDELQVALARLP